MARTMIFIFASLMMLAIVEAEAQYGMLDFSPRFMFGSVAKRQSDGSACMVGYHSCAEVLNSSTDCCPNDSYCYLAPGGSAGNVSCCAIGSNCENQCTSSEIAVPQTITINGNATSTFSCSARSCVAASAFQCPEDLGGGCCSYGSTCGPSSTCVSTTDSATVIPAAPTATGACGTGQFSCPAGEGGGCCNNGATCTAADSTLLCVATITTGSGSITPTAIRTGPSGIIDSNFTMSASSGLSSGAKAGIGVGVALAVIIVVIGILWFAVSRRIAASRERYLAQSTSGGMTEGSIGGEKSPRTKNGTDYFGSAGKTGPFTDVTGKGFTPLESPEPANRGVAGSPQGPGDIAAPVEIGGSEHHVPRNPYASDVPEKPEFRIEMP